MNVLIACEEEVWRDIPGYEGLYQASSLGNIRSLERKYTDSIGRTKTLKQKMLSVKTKSDGDYPHVNLGNGNYKKVHTLVALAFLGPRPPKADVRHLDGNKQNNRANNLRYGTRSENNLDGYTIRGYVTKYQKLNPQKAEEIREKLSQGYSQRMLANEYAVSRSTIRAIKNFELYPVTGGQYECFSGM